MLVGVGALLTKKKFKCQACGEYNDAGNAKPYKGPASKRLGRKYASFTAMHGIKDGVEAEDDDPTEEAPDGSDQDGDAPADPAPPPAPPPPPPPVTDAGWHPDPTKRHELRYHDGGRWTEHVSDRGVSAVDPV